MKKRYFAQNDVLTATGHRSAYFDTIEGCARLWKEIEQVPGSTP